jgi:transcriptional regulator with XRE-family HTH domain
LIDNLHAATELGRRIAALRRTRNLTQAQLAKLVGCSVDFVSLVERGVNAPTVARLEQYAKVLNVAVRDLFTFDQRKRRSSTAGKRR